MTTPNVKPGRSRLFATSLLSQLWTYPAISCVILLLDMVTGPFILFPIFFVIPVGLAAWFCSARLAYALAFLLPLGRFFIAIYMDQPFPFPYIVANGVIRVLLLLFIAYLVSRTARQTKELERRVEGLVTLCAWSNTVEYEGEWISFEQYLQRRFKINTSHGISPAEFEKAFAEVHSEAGDA